MHLIRSRAAVAPVRRSAERSGVRRRSVLEVVAARRPTEPMLCLRPGIPEMLAGRFVDLFPGDVLYAVKCNPEPAVLQALWKGGVRHFDVASLAEARLVRQLFPQAAIHFMHPVKARPAIRIAYHDLGVRDFVLDGAAELDKIEGETGRADDLGLFVRLALPKGKAVYDLSGKFGAPPEVAAELLRACRGKARTLGLCFHVGSQCLDPQAYADAIALAAQVVEQAGVAIDVLDIGGGFPVAYPDVMPPPIGAFFDAIATAFARTGLNCRLWCEPGRALVAPAVSLVVQVLARRDDWLFINDGVYGNLSDAGVPKFRFPARLIRPGGEDKGELRPFSFYGPTCDSADRMDGPFWLPEDVREGEWIELGQLGAYASTLRTGFNGFDHTLLAEVRDMPLLDMPGYAMAAAG